MEVMVERMVTQILEKGAFPVLIGGEHSATPPAVFSTNLKHPGLKVVVIDAHLDYRAEYLENKSSHACATRNISGTVGVENVVPIGVRSICKEEKEDADEHGLRFVPASDVKSLGIGPCLDQALEWLGEGPVYLSVDADGIDPSYAPGVGNPEPFGITDDDVKECIGRLGPRLVGFDIVEVCPPFDNGNTAALAARLIREAIAVRWSYLKD